MAQDLKKLFKNEQKVSNLKMPDGHEARFLKKLDEELPIKSSNRRFTFFNVAASNSIKFQKDLYYISIYFTFTLINT